MVAALALTLLMGGVAYANGANDVSKGVATLVGSGVGGDRLAHAWGSAWTVAGVLAAGIVSRELVAVFSGSVLAAPPGSPAFPAAVAAGAIGWLGIATWTGLPVSTTHALVGGLVGAGLATGGSAAISWTAVAYKVGLPLAVSPLVALALVFAVVPGVTSVFQRANRYCVCVERYRSVLAPAAEGPSMAAATELHVIAGANCPPQVLTRLNTLNAAHWISAGLTSFARALNDAPKILAIGLVAAPTLGVGTGPLFGVVAVAMGAGSHLAGRRVTRTLAGRVTQISPHDGLAANLVTAALVFLASGIAAPVSTTHVSTGAIVAVGMHRRRVHWKLVREVLLAWVVTLPVAAAIAAAGYWMVVR